MKTLLYVLFDRLLSDPANTRICLVGLLAAAAYFGIRIFVAFL